MPDFLLEIGLEEIPARMIAPAQAELAQRVGALVEREHLLPAEVKADSVTRSYSTPRRLAVLVENLLERQPDWRETLFGPPWSVAFKDGQPGAAARAFAKKAGVEVGALEKATLPKGDYTRATVAHAGLAAAEVLARHLPSEIDALYWPKNMYWRRGRPERFVRPVKWLLALLDSSVVPVEFAGVRASNLTYGHRVLHGRAALVVDRADAYLGVLERAKVTADVDLRRHRIRKALDEAARSISGARWREDASLVDTVTHLTEWPSVVVGGFDAEYLKLPEEVLVTVMRDHQKYFAVEDARGKLVPYFLAVLNTQPTAKAEGIIRHGNERVLRARFRDARFFWDVDRRTRLEDRVEALKSVTFQKDLGSYWDKTEANLEVARSLAEAENQAAESHPGAAKVDEEALRSAVRLAKADLTTELVKEFTELQGIVGGLYAGAEGLDRRVAEAIYWQYSPSGVEGGIPPTVEGQILGIADRLQTIAAMFEIGLEPTGSKDPFGLRRAANGIIKILAESELRIGIPVAAEVPAESPADPSAKLSLFFRERLEFYLRDVRGFAYDVTGAVLAATQPGGDQTMERQNNVRDAVARADALTAVRGSEDFLAVSAAFKRMKNILRQAKEKFGFSYETEAGAAAPAAEEPAERDLRARLGAIRPGYDQARRALKYREALEQAAGLRPEIDRFFRDVLVMAEDEKIRAGRLALLGQILTAFSSIADFSEIVTG